MIKKYPAMVVILWIVTFFLFMFGFMIDWPNVATKLIYWTVVVVVIAGIFISLIKIYRSEVRRIGKELVDRLYQGDLDGFICQMTQYLGRARKPEQAWMIAIDLSAALSFKGSWDEARRMLEQVDCARLKPFWQLAYANNLLSIILMQEDLVEARRIREKFDHLLRDKSLSAQHVEMQGAVENTLATYDLFMGDLEQSKVTISRQLDGETRPLVKGWRYYQLGLIAQRQGQMEACRSHYDEAARLASTSCIPEMIRKQLGSLSDDFR